MSAQLVIYGAYGYTGRLIAEQALAAGLRPLLSGRNPERLAEVAAQTGLDWRAADLNNPQTLDSVLSGARVVIHAAGPFSGTWRAMAEACLRTRTHYLDITGEIEVFEGLAALSEQARTAGVVLLPGTGFDVVPSDCLAAHLKRRLPEAEALELAFMGGGGLSRGTQLTMLEGLGEGGAVRRDGRIVPVPAAYRSRRVDFGFGVGERAVVTIPWGDVSTAYHTTGIPNVMVYTAMPRSARRMLVASRFLGPLLRSNWIRRRMARNVEAGRAGPDAERRAASTSVLWGEARASDGRRVASRLQCPNGYSLTGRTAIACAQRVFAGLVPGFHTPAGLFGPDFILEFDAEREDID